MMLGVQSQLAKSFARVRTSPSSSYLFLAFSVFGFFASVPQNTRAQAVPGVVVKGRVLDDSTSTPLPLVNVFIANSTLGTVTDTVGRFEIERVPIGPQDIVASMVGYQHNTKAVRLTDSSNAELEFRLKPQSVQVPAVVVEGRDPIEWKKRLKRFDDAFLGSTSNASRCRILNPEILDFFVDKKTGRFTATARAPLQIENYALGYRCQYFLQLFRETKESWQYTSYQYVGVAKFEQMKADNKDEAKQWQMSRRRAYEGSERHFLTALLQKDSRRDGFRINRIRKYWVQAALQRPAGFEIDEDELVKPGDLPFQRRLSIEQPLQIVYTHLHQTRYSVIELDRPSIIVYTNGYPEDPLSMLTYGYWAYQRFSDALPIDYTPDE